MKDRLETSAQRRPIAGLLPLLALPVALLLMTAASARSAQSAGSTLRLDADEAARRAVEVSHRAAAAGERVSGAVSDVAAADAARLPKLSAAAAAEERSSVPELDAPLGPQGELITIFPDIRNAYGLTVDLTQPIYAGGSITASRQAARHELAATRADQASAQSVVGLQARLAYWRVASGRAAVIAAESQERRAERLLADARSLREAGMAVNADVLGGEARAAAARVEVIRAQTFAGDALAELRSLLDLDRGTEVELTDAVPGALPPAPDPLSVLQAEARRTRPEVVALAARVDALAEREKAARAPARPSVGAVAAWSMARPNQRFLPLTDEWNDSWSVGISARWALWDGGRTRAEVAAVGSRRSALAEELAETERRIDLDVERSRLALDSALAAVAAADASQEASAARLAAEEDRYRAGLATTTDVLDAQGELALAERQQVEARTAAWMASAQLDWAVGR